VLLANSSPNIHLLLACLLFISMQGLFDNFTPNGIVVPSHQGNREVFMNQPASLQECDDASVLIK